MTTGWKIERACRAALLERFPPSYQRVVADHVTFKPDLAEGVPGAAETPRIVGRANDDAGVEAYVVEIAGGTARPDGSTWHVTWSLGPGREAYESNRVIAECDWQPIEPAPLVLVAARW